MGVARAVLGVLPAGCHRDLHPAPAARDPDLPGGSCQGTNDQEPLEGTHPEPQQRLGVYCPHGWGWRRRVLVEESVLVLVQVAEVIKGRATLNGAHSCGGPADWTPPVVA